MNSKLRFYMRGLGIGIAVTALILSIVNLNKKNGSMTDAEIKARAAQLGMVEGNSFSLTDAVGGKDKSDDTSKPKVEIVEPDEPETKDEPVVEDEPVIEDEPVVGGETEGTEEGEPDADEPNDVTESASGEPEKQETEKPEETEPQVVAPDGTTVQIVVYAGNGSEIVASRLKEAGLIQDANDFNSYMCKNGYDRTIRVGTHSIPKGATYEEICKLIA